MKTRGYLSSSGFVVSLRPALARWDFISKKIARKWMSKQVTLSARLVLKKTKQGSNITHVFANAALDMEGTQIHETDCFSFISRYS